MNVVKNILKGSVSLLLTSALLVACNKVYEPIPGPVSPVVDPANTLGKKIAANPNYSILNAALVRTGLNTVLDEPNAKFTLFAPSNAAFAASGISLAVVNALPVAQLTSILQHHVIPNERIPAAGIPTTFPNVQKGSGLNLTTTTLVPGLTTSAIPIKITVYPSRRATGAWVNNVPIIAPDSIVASNGVGHGVAVVVAPPAPQTFLQAFTADTTLAYLLKAVERADSGQAANSQTSFRYALSQPLASLTIFAPTNQAFRNLLTNAIAQVLIGTGLPDFVAFPIAAQLASSPDVFTNPAVTPVLTPTFVRGILAYHVLGQRAFAPNFPETAANFPTFLNGVIANHPGLSINASFTGPFATGLSIKGVGNASPATAAPTATGAVDRAVLNGVYYKIDQVLLPQ